ncbi:MAG: DUF3035 domain-containing protein [Alphaproteobacteria bacterium]|nr:DUF3035 domain-containing protein [Alphaproteobacteria bacterium]
MSNPNTGSKTILKLRAPIMALAVCALALSGCAGNSLKRQFGLLRTPPDEFAVVPKAPLSMPPDMNLRAPRPGAESLPEQLADEQTRTAVFGTDAAITGPGITNPQALTSDKSAGERSLLGQAGAQYSDPNIRRTVDRETADLVEAQDGFLRKLMAYGTGDTDPNLALVDAEGETRRLRENRALGRPVTEGETPEVEPPAPKSFLENILGNFLGL